MLAEPPPQMNAHLCSWEAAPAPHIPTIKVAASFGMTNCSIFSNKVTIFFTFAWLQKKCKVVIPIEGGQSLVLLWVQVVPLLV